MSHTTPPGKLGERQPSAIIRIAYHQWSLMTGIKDPTLSPKRLEPKALKPDEIMNEDTAWSLIPAPMLATVTTNLHDQYKSLTSYSDSLRWFLDNAKNHFTEGIQNLTPLSRRILATLETQLNGVGDAFRSGQDYLQRNVPSISEIKDCFRSALITTIHWLDFALGALRKQLAELSSSLQGNTEDSKGSKDISVKNNK